MLGYPNIFDQTRKPSKIGRKPHALKAHDQTIWDPAVNRIVWTHTHTHGKEHAIFLWCFNFNH